MTKFYTGTPERNVVYAWEGEVTGLRAEIERLRALIRDAYEEGFETAGGTAWKEWWEVSEARRALEPKP